ncbi:MAG: enoyl-CoA hydratase/isomerase family protein [Deltaproteobacteria bacterium]|nr:enoyl-CoA hydratase/isomerase family protein [Deltaproteobacteria bacterium]
MMTGVDTEMDDYGITLEYLDHIAIIRFERPERRNAFNEVMWNEFDGVITQLKQKIPRVVILTGAGNESFSAGFDVNVDNPQVAGLVEVVETHDRAPVEKLIRRIRSVVDRLFDLPIPIIAAMNGSAYGGGAELAVRCDMRVMEPDAVICFSEVRLGLMPDWGGAAALPRLIGPARAAEMILTAREVTAQEALSCGLINRMSVPGKALDESIDVARMIAGNGPRAVRSALEVIRSTSNPSLENALALEMEKAISLITTGECFYGISAFLSKEKPEFPDSTAETT